MKILVFSLTYHPFIGGAEVAVKEITKRLPEHEFTILTLRIDKTLPLFEKQGNVSIYRIGLPSRRKLNPSLNWKLMVNKYLFPFHAFFQARKLHRQIKFDATWSIMANYAGFAALFFKQANPTVPFLLTLQEGDSPEHIKKRVGPFMPLYRKIFLKADHIQTISKFLRDYALQMGRKEAPIVIPNGVDVNNFSRGTILEKKTEDIQIITTSRLVAKNGVDILISSLVYLPQNYKLLIVGEGEEGQELKKLTEHLGLKDRVRFGGFIPQEELPIYLRASHIFARPSRSEGFGNSFIEAMASRIPVIGTPVGGIPDFLRHEETGLMCEPENPEDLAKQVKRLVEDHKLRETLIENAWQMVLKEYSWDIVSNNMRAVFKKMA